jgi:hypothetical protein
MMGTRAGFHSNQTARPSLKKRQKLTPAELTTNDNPSLVINAVDLDDILGEINAGCAKLQHGWLLLLGTDTPSWRIATPGAGANHTINRNGLLQTQSSPEAHRRQDL